jgi:hypothetical protein
MEAMEDLYLDDPGFLVLTPQGNIARFSKTEMPGEFRSRRDAGEPPLSTEKRVLHSEEQGDQATAVLYRRMGRQVDPALCELRLRKVEGKCLVEGGPCCLGPTRLRPGASCRHARNPRGSNKTEEAPFADGWRKSAELCPSPPRVHE